MQTEAVVHAADTTASATPVAARTWPEPHPLIKRLLAGGPFGTGSEVRAADIEAFEAMAGDAVLFFPGDPVRFPEALDVAVVLPELLAATVRQARVGVVPRDAEDALARRYAVQRWPSLVFLRDGGYLGTLSGMQDWDVYLASLRTLLAREPGRRPAPTIAIQPAGASNCH